MSHRIWLRNVCGYYAICASSARDPCRVTCLQFKSFWQLTLQFNIVPSIRYTLYVYTVQCTPYSSSNWSLHPFDPYLHLTPNSIWPLYLLMCHSTMYPVRCTVHRVPYTLYIIVRCAMYSNTKRCSSADNGLLCNTRKNIQPRCINIGELNYGSVFIITYWE